MSCWKWRVGSYGWARNDYYGILGWKRICWRLWKRNPDFVWKG